MSTPTGPGRRFSVRAQAAAVCGGLALAAAGAYFLLVAPKRAEASELDERIAAVQTELDEARARALVKPVLKVRPQELFRLARVMPDRPDMPGIILDLNGLARDTGIVFQSIAPGAPVGREAFYTLPVALSFEGDFYSLSDFLFRLRNLVALRNGSMTTRGRLYAVSGIEFAQTEHFPRITARLTVDAYVFGAPPTAAGAPAASAPAAPEGSQEGQTTETGTTAEESEAPPADASATEGGS